MICPKCGHETSGNYCNNCGEPLSTGYLMESAEEYEIRKRLSEELAGLEEQAAASTQPVMEGQRSRGDWTVKNERSEENQPYTDNQSLTESHLSNGRGSRNTLNDTEADDNESYQPRSRKPEKQKPKEKTAKSKKSKEGSDGRKAESKGERKEQQKKEARMKKLEGEVERLRSSQENGSQENDSREKVRPVSRGMAGRKAQREENWDWAGGERSGSAYSGLPRGKNQSSRSMRGNTDSRVSRDFDIPDSETRIIEKTDKDGVSFGDVVVKSMVTATVIISRVMQLASFLLMAGMVFLMAQSFWEHGQALGDIRFMAAESNYGMALYVGFAGITLFMGLIWCLWIPSKTGAGGGVRMKKYDTGRGFVPFLLCMAAVVAAAVILPEIPAEAEAWKGMANGAAAAMEAVNSHRDILFLGSTAGAVLSLVRKLLRV